MNANKDFCFFDNERFDPIRFVELVDASEFSDSLVTASPGKAGEGTREFRRFSAFSKGGTKRR